MKVHFGPRGRMRKDGSICSSVFVSIEGGAWHGHYRVSSGASPEETASRIAALQDHHAKKCKRMTGFAGVRNVEIVLSKRLFRIVDCTIHEAGEQPGEVNLYLDVREDEGRVSGFPVIQRFASINDVPENGAIVALIRARLADLISLENKHSDFVARTNALLGMGG